MRIALLALMVMGCSGEQAAMAVDAAVQVDPLAARMALCGPSPGAAPVLDPATMTDAHGYQYIALSIDHWTADAAYIAASSEWANCITYGVK